MGRIYAVREDNGESVLVALRCDGCDAEIKPHPEIRESGWIKVGSSRGPGDMSEAHYCPDCAIRR